MSLEDTLFEQRLSRARQIQELGFRPYGQRFEFTHTIPEILAAHAGSPSGARTARAQPSEQSGALGGPAEGSAGRASSLEELDHDKPRVSIAGRIQTMRRMGKAG